MTSPAPGPGAAPAASYFGPTAGYASWGRRVAATILDTAVLVVLYLLVMGCGTALSALVARLADPERFADGTMPPIMVVGMALSLLASLVGMFCYRWLLHARSGQTLAKRWLGIRVVDADTGRPPTRTASFLREVVYVVTSQCCFLITLVDVLWPLWDERAQTLHDKAGGTVVITA
ncbi:RDD family protein [Nocardiopsis trehalosi]|jgi:uncharacterized RDD family membrane protein YckC|uniref:RDD family protein n=1 Tax=Nocardiopsis trehalosi TaxID=109329 RepID=UPI00083398C1|nr:RDD family protein [Nocardiopsis trehalosi]